ncbi:putative pterin-4-alpha-carbinolamine dehydratase [Streptosporangium jomthongense]|uniref:Putative pterin-4-alpha-carbinolamine dehydratase n=1 Tax=Marinobacter aromaticivorans TaxID=1494078 RepID=A0ABW2IW88_9GAMM|nr:4a-hydroxytetrahydrobiopterin dehydratase [Marinobacter aromaticivorans]GGE71338.1 putative pterin-4-alpha-carbinolamine dehydratase [Streptosporangium jomthongense]
MSGLAEQHCEACSANAPGVTDEEKRTLHEDVPDWEILSVSGEEQLRRVFKFRNFAQALAFTNKVGELAEAENHHPAILLEYGKATISWWTHAIGGLHKNDFIMAARTDSAYH